MKHDERLQRQQEVLRCLSGLPRMMLMLKERNNIPEFVLYDLCNPECFNLKKAAYFVDNPDFNCLQGVAGVSLDEVGIEKAEIWQKPDDFSSAMDSSPFNQEVRSIERTSLKLANGSEEQIINELAELLDITHPSTARWDMKHDNFGILLFEKNPSDDCDLHDHLIDGLSMLGFCPIL